MSMNICGWLITHFILYLVLYWLELNGLAYNYSRSALFIIMLNTVIGSYADIAKNAKIKTFKIKNFTIGKEHTLKIKICII